MTNYMIYTLMLKNIQRHFKDFSPTSEYLGWRGEVDKRNLYKRHGKFHNAFDNKEDNNHDGD